MGRPRRQRMARGQLALFEGQSPQEKTAATVGAIDCGSEEGLGCAFNRNHTTDSPAARFHFAVFERGRFSGIASAPTRSAARVHLRGGAR